MGKGREIGLGNNYLRTRIELGPFIYRTIQVIRLVMGNFSSLVGCTICPGAGGAGEYHQKPQIGRSSHNHHAVCSFCDE
jgi:hypothetical protein